MKKILLVLSIQFLCLLVAAKEPHFYVYPLNGIPSTGPLEDIDYCTVGCGEPLKVTAVYHPPLGSPISGGIVDWYLDGVYQFTKGGIVEFEEQGLVTFSCWAPFGTGIFLFTSENKIMPSFLPPGPYVIGLQVYNSNYTSFDDSIYSYHIPYNGCLQIAPYAFNECAVFGLETKWYVDDIYYASTPPRGIVCIDRPGLITAYDTSLSMRSRYKILLKIDPAEVSSTSGIFPFPFSQLPGISTDNLRYTIISAMGQIMEQGDFSGEIILRNNNPQRSLPEGIYFVIYSDALDNRQVLTDKVFVGN